MSNIFKYMLVLYLIIVYNKINQSLVILLTEILHFHYISPLESNDIHEPAPQCFVQYSMLYSLHAFTGSNRIWLNPSFCADKSPPGFTKVSTGLCELHQHETLKSSDAGIRPGPQPGIYSPHASWHKPVAAPQQLHLVSTLQTCRGHETSTTWSLI